jgi:Phage-related minor tail protein
MAVKYPLSVVITAVDKWTAPLSRMTGAVNKTLRPIKDLGTRLADLGQAAGVSKVSDALGGVASAAAGVGQAFTRAFLRVGALIAGVSYALYEVVGGTARAGDEAIKAARKLNIGVEAYQELAYAASLAGLETETFDKAMGFFSRRVGQVALGNKQAWEGFRRLGINVFDAGHKLRPVDELLGEVADHLQLLDDPLKRNAILALLFGKNAAQLTTLLSKGSKGLREAAAEAHELNVVIGPETAQAGEDFLDQWKRLSKAIEGVRNAIGEELLPVFEQLAVSLRKFLVAHRAEIAAWAKRFAAGLPQRLEKLGKLFDDLVRGLTPLVNAFADFVEFVGPVPVLLGAIAAIIAISVIPAVASLVSAIVALSGVIVGTPFGWILLAAAAVVLALASIVAAAVALYVYWDEVTWFMRTAWMTAVAVVKLQATNLWSSLKQGFSDAYDWIAAKVKAISDLVPDWLKDTLRFTGRLALPPGAELGIRLARAVGETAAGAAGQSTIKVEFSNAPKGLRVTGTREGGPDLDLSLGYSMVGGQ